MNYTPAMEQSDWSVRYDHGTIINSAGIAIDSSSRSGLDLMLYCRTGCYCMSARQLVRQGAWGLGFDNWLVTRGLDFSNSW